MARKRSRPVRDPVAHSVERLAAFNQIDMVLDTLSEREAAVISMRFGMDDGEPKTYDQIGKVFGLTRGTIRQIESKVMSKLRHQSRSSVVIDYLDTEGIAPIRRLTDERSRELLQQYVDSYIAKLFRDQELFDKLPPCPQCSKRVPLTDGGRPRIYCSNKCRQEAYRNRRRI